MKATRRSSSEPETKPIQAESYEMPGDFHDSAAVQRVAAELGRSPSMAVSRAGQPSDILSDSPRRRQGFLSRILPDPVERARMRGEALMVEKDSEFMRQVVDLLRQTQLANLQELADATRARVRGEMRKEVSEHFSRQWNELRDELSRQFYELTLKLEIEAARADQLTLNMSRDAVYHKIESDITRFFALQHQLMSAFQKLTERETNR
jgi:hypothetical protein